jgi:hypothetical protein
MDLVGAYLAAKPDSENLVVSTRFGHNMLGFKGEIDSLGPGGSWTRADYVVLYIQQVQRRLDPSPGFIDYFQARSPEKVITLGGLDYAWIFPVPFTVPADPKVSRAPEQLALLGYRWEAAPEAGQTTLRLYWENLGLPGDRQVVTRLTGPQAGTEWTACLPDPEFAGEAVTSGAYLESLCSLPVSTLPPDHYTVEFGLAAATASIADIRPILFPQGWQAARITASGHITDTPEIERLNEIARQRLPLDTVRLDRVYGGDLRLLGYQLHPAQPAPNDEVELTLYWQAIEPPVTPHHLIVQLADSRRLPLGRFDGTLPEAEGERWFPGEINVTRHLFTLSAELDAPLAGQIEVSLLDEAEVPLQPARLAGEPLGPVIARFTIAPPTWPTLDEAIGASATWEAGSPNAEIALRGYVVAPPHPQPGETLSITLFWETSRPVEQDYMVFVHLLDESGQIIAQNDSLPRGGAYPTPWWQPGQVVEDTHSIPVPENLAGGTYRLVVGLYEAENGERLGLTDGNDSYTLGMVKIN